MKPEGGVFSLEEALKKAVKVPASKWEEKMYQLLNRNRDTFFAETFFLVQMDAQALDLSDLIEKLLKTGLYGVYLGKLEYIHKAGKIYFENMDMMLSYKLHRDEYELFFVDDMPFMVKKSKLREIELKNQLANQTYV